MNTSETIAALAKALAAFNAEVQNPAKGHTADVRSKKGEGSSYSFGYADLQDITDAVRAPLAAHGLSIVQDLLIDTDAVGAVTTLLHESGEWLSFSPARVAIGSTPDGGVTGAVTTSRRLSLMAALDLAAAEDPDAAKTRRAAPRPNGGKASSKQIAKAQAEAARAHVGEGGMRKAVRQNYKLEAAEKTVDELLGMLTVAQASDLIERLIKEADRRIAAAAAGANPDTGEVPKDPAPADEPADEPSDAGPPEDPDADADFWQGEAPGEPPADDEPEPPGMDGPAARKSWEKPEPKQGGML